MARPSPAVTLWWLLGGCLFVGCGRVGYAPQGGEPGSLGGASASGGASGASALGSAAGASGAGPTPSYPTRPVVAWARLLGGAVYLPPTGTGTPDDGAVALALSGTNIVVAGRVVGEVDFGAGSVSSGQPQWAESFVAAYSATNQHQWHQRFASPQGLSNAASALLGKPDGLRVAGVYDDNFDAKLAFFLEGASGYVLDLSPSGAIDAAANLPVGGSGLEALCLVGPWIAGYAHNGMAAEVDGIDTPGVFLASLNSARTGLYAGAVFGGGARTLSFSDCAGDALGGAYLAGWIDGSVDNVAGGSVNTVGGQDSFLIAVEPTWAHRWVITLGGLANDRAKRVVHAGNVVYLLSEFEGTLTRGATATSTGLRDILVTAHAPSSGALQWARVIGGAGNDSVSSAAADAAGNLIFTGYHRTPLLRGISSDLVGPLAKAGTFLTSLSPAGDVLWGMDLEELVVHAMVVSPLGEIYLSGVTLDPITYGATTLSPAYQDGFLMKLEQR